MRYDNPLVRLKNNSRNFPVYEKETLDQAEKTYVMALFLELRAKRITKTFNTRSVYLRYVLGFISPMFFLGFLCLI